MEEPSTDPPGRRHERGPDEAFCRNCGAVISDRAEICPECGVRQRPPPNSSLDSAVDDVLGGGNPFVAAALSALFPGLGQLYNRQLEKGMALIGAGVVAALSTIIVVGIVLYPLVWLYAIYDAYRVAERQEPTANPGGPDRGDAGRRFEADAGADVDFAGTPDTADRSAERDATRTDARDEGAAGRD